MALFFSAAAGGVHASVYEDLEGAVTHAGTLWIEGQHEIDGHWYIDVLEDGRRFLRLGDDFETKQAPDLRIVLSSHEADALSERNVLTGGVVLGPLASHTGAQSFEIPDGVDLDDVRSVAIHCERFNVFWGAASFTEGRVVYAGDSWTKKAERVRGSYEIAEVAGGYVLRTSSDFRTKDAPDLKFVLSSHSVRDAKSRNALEGGVVIGRLRSNTGAEVYELPDGVDPSAHRTLLIHCERYTKLWAAVPLEASD